jgi:hypothetical protein
VAERSDLSELEVVGRLLVVWRHPEGSVVSDTFLGPMVMAPFEASPKPVSRRRAAQNARNKIQTLPRMICVAI